MRKRVRKKSAKSAPILGGVRISHPDRVLFAGAGFTKLDLARYFDAVAEHLLPEIAGRPLSLVRCPDGIAGDCFFQKHAGAGFSSAVRRIPIRETGGKALYLSVSSKAGLLALAQMNAIELHPWGAREDDVDHADRLVFDFDPGPGAPWGAVVEAARECRDRLTELELQSFVRTTGGKGLHVVLPIARRHDWEEVRGFAHRFAERMAAANPRRYVAKAAKSARRDRVFIDYMRNGRGATAIANYSPRARPGATVATPIAWEELSPKLDPRRFTVATIPERLAGMRADPWRALARLRQRLPKLGGAAVK